MVRTARRATVLLGQVTSTVTDEGSGRGTNGDLRFNSAEVWKIAVLLVAKKEGRTFQKAILATTIGS